MACQTKPKVRNISKKKRQLSQEQIDPGTEAATTQLAKQYAKQVTDEEDRALRVLNEAIEKQEREQKKAKKKRQNTT